MLLLRRQIPCWAWDAPAGEWQIWDKAAPQAPLQNKRIMKDWGKYGAAGAASTAKAEIYMQPTGEPQVLTVTYPKQAREARQEKWGGRRDGLAGRVYCSLAVRQPGVVDSLCRTLLVK
eukprot:gene11716-biopygen352